MKKILLLLVLVISLTACKKKDVVTELAGTPVAGNGLVDVLWTLDKPHGSVCWESNYLDYSVGKLTGRFNNYGFLLNLYLTRLIFLTVKLTLGLLYLL
ncbi:MAG: hypothetical protein IPH32_15535 [Bacteroidetes bacterium]|nr:hypothetical protein [Bacteroidota bacterium]